MEPSPSQIDSTRLPQGLPPQTFFESKPVRLIGAAVAALVAAGAIHHIVRTQATVVYSVLSGISIVAALALTYLGLKQGRTEKILAARAQFFPRLDKLSYSEICEQGLIAHTIFTREELNRMFSQQIAAPNGPRQFMQFHTDRVFEALDDANKALLKQAFSENLHFYTGLDSFTSDPWVQKLGAATPANCAKLLNDRIDRFEAVEYTYEKFVSENGEEAFKYLDASDTLRQKFKVPLLNAVKDIPITRLIQERPHLFLLNWLSFIDKTQENCHTLGRHFEREVVRRGNEADTWRLGSATFSSLLELGLMERSFLQRWAALHLLKKTPFTDWIIKNPKNVLPAEIYALLTNEIARTKKASPTATLTEEFKKELRNALKPFADLFAMDVCSAEIPFSQIDADLIALYGLEPFKQAYSSTTAQK